MENTNSDVLPTRSSRTLLGDPAGLGTLPMNSLNHEGYDMSNPSDFYSKFILDLVPNNAYDDNFYYRRLRPVQPMQPRIGTKLWSAPLRNYINGPACMNVMYSHDPLARGKISRVDEVSVPSDRTAYWEARAMRFEGSARPRLISFPLPAKPEKYVWIDLSWPIRSILLPVSMTNYPGEKPNCTYAELDFKRMQGRLPTGGWAEEGNQTFSSWVGDNTRGLVWTVNVEAAVMRIDLELLYLLLTIPKNLRKPDYNVLGALQLQRWDAVAYNPQLPINNNPIMGIVSNYPLDSGRFNRSSTVGVAYDTFLSNINGVQVQFPPPSPGALASILNQIVSIALNFVPVCGPLLAMGSALVIRAIEDPSSMEVKNLLTAEFGIELMGAIIGSAQSYQSVKNPAPKSSRSAAAPEMAKPLSYYGDSAEDYKLNPNIMDPTEEEKKMAKQDPEKKNDSAKPETT